MLIALEVPNVSYMIVHYILKNSSQIIIIIHEAIREKINGVENNVWKSEGKLHKLSQLSLDFSQNILAGLLKK